MPVMIRLRPTQIDLTRRDVRDSTERIHRRREALLANVVNRQERWYALDDVDPEPGVSAKRSNPHGVRSVYGPDARVPERPTQDQRIRGVSWSSGPLSSNPLLSAVPSISSEAQTDAGGAAHGHRWPSGSDLIHAGLGSLPKPKRPVEDSRGIIVSRGSFHSVHEDMLDLLRDEQSSVEHFPSLKRPPPGKARVAGTEHDRTGRAEGSSGGAQRMPSRRVPWEDELRQIECRLSRRLTLHGPSAEDEQSDHVPSPVNDPEPSHLEGFECPPSSDHLNRPGGHGPFQRQKLPPSRLHISQAALSSSPGKETIGPDGRDTGRCEESSPGLPGSPAQWKRYRLQLESAWSEDSETESESIYDWNRRMKGKSRNAIGGGRSSSSFASSGDRASSVVRRPSQQMSPPTPPSEPPSPLSGSRLPGPSGRAYSPSPVTSDDLPSRPSVSRRRSQMALIGESLSPAALSSIIAETPRGSVPSGITAPAPGPRSSRRSMQVYNDQLPSSEQPQTPSHRHSRPFDPAFTAPAGLRRVFRLSRTRRHQPSGSPTRAEDVALGGDGSGGGTEQENVSVLVEAARWEQRIRASLERRNWRSWGVRRRHSGELPVVDVDPDDPHLDGLTRDGNLDEATRRLDRTPDREMPRMTRG